MKKQVFGAVSALAFTASVLPIAIPSLVPVAQAQAGFVPNAPYVASAGIAGAAGDRHFITVAVAAFPINAVVIECTNLAGVRKATVTNQFGERVAATTAVSKSPEGGMALTVTLNKPVQPGNVLRIVMDGVEQNREGGAMLYRVSALTDNISYPFPVGTAMLLEPVLND